jgi:3-hydroxyacyl-CoA dehydrogenase
VPERVAIVGSGFIGRAWAIAFARAGREVRLWDPAAGAVESCLATVGGLIEDLASQGLLDDQAPDAVRGRMRPATDPSAALEGSRGSRRTRPSGSR